ASLACLRSILGPALAEAQVPERSRQRPRPAGGAGGDRYGSESPLSATWRPSVQERALLVGLGAGADGGDGLSELAALARAAGAEPVGRVVQSRSTPDPATFVGKGKLAEIHDLVHTTGAEAVILDDELSPGQLR